MNLLIYNQIGHFLLLLIDRSTPRDMNLLTHTVREIDERYVNVFIRLLHICFIYKQTLNFDTPLRVADTNEYEK